MFGETGPQGASLLLPPPPPPDASLPSLFPPLM